MFKKLLIALRLKKPATKAAPIPPPRRSYTASPVAQPTADTGITNAVPLYSPLDSGNHASASECKEPKPFLGGGGEVGGAGASGSWDTTSSDSGSGYSSSSSDYSNSDSSSSSSCSSD